MKKILIVLFVSMLFVSCNLFGQSVDVRGIWNPNPPSDNVDYYQVEWFQSNTPDTLSLGTPDIVMQETGTQTTTPFTVDSNYVFIRIRAHNTNGFGAYSDFAYAAKGDFTVPNKANSAGILLWE